MVADEESNFVGFKGFVELDCEHEADVVLSLEIKNVTLNYSLLRSDISSKKNATLVGLEMEHVLLGVRIKTTMKSVLS